jgi:hypothetical protein
VPYSASNRFTGSTPLSSEASSGSVPTTALSALRSGWCLALQVTGHALSDGMRQLGEFTIGWRFNPAKPCGPVITADVHSVQKEHVEVDEIKGPAKSLNQGDGPGMCGGFGIAGFMG